FWGGVVAMLRDAVDVILIDALGLGGFGGHYHRTDKLLDSYYLALEMVVAWRWTNPWAKWTSALLFVYPVDRRGALRGDAGTHRPLHLPQPV
ncbi:MAG: hypothetical protein KC470_09655, partial [Dehalococcoidia bacterium]|nr:hypothetical protein [Dehalococcoidia bacterium]